MKVTVRLLSPFSDAVGRPQVDVAVPEGATVRHLVIHLCEQFPQLRPHIYESSGGMTEYLTMFLNDRPVLDFDIVLGKGDDLLMMFPVSGG